MTIYRVAVRKDDGTVEAQTTEDEDDALDWFGNGVDAVFDREDNTVETTLEVEGVVWGMVKEPEISREVIEGEISG